jgi:hypothetical protein
MPAKPDQSPAGRAQCEMKAKIRPCKVDQAEPWRTKVRVPGKFFQKQDLQIGACVLVSASF